MNVTFACAVAHMSSKVQDFSPAEISALLLLCKNPNAVTMTGDTCQTINAGSAFNFQQLVHAFREHRLGALRHTREGAKIYSMLRVREEDLQHVSQQAQMHQELDRKRRANKLISDALARRGVQARNIETKTSLRDDLGDASRQLASAETKVREARECLLELQKRFLVMSLRFNYRCKAGIAATASSVSQLLLERFPRAADFIQEETTTPGSKPLFVRLSSNSLLSLYLRGGLACVCKSTLAFCFMLFVFCH